MGNPRWGCSAGRIRLPTSRWTLMGLISSLGSGFRLRQPARTSLQRGVIGVDSRTLSVTSDAFGRPRLTMGCVDAAAVQHRGDRAVGLQFAQCLDQRLQFARRQLAAAERPPSTQPRTMAAGPRISKSTSSSVFVDIDHDLLDQHAYQLLLQTVRGTRVIPQSSHVFAQARQLLELGRARQHRLSFVEGPSPCQSPSATRAKAVSHSWPSA